MFTLRKVLLLILLAPTVLGAQSPGGFGSRLQEIVDEERARSQTPGISAALLVDGVVVAEAASGLAHREARVAVTPETLFGAASVSKLFTAVLVMRQVEQGKLSLDAPANNWLEPAVQIRDANGLAVPATLRQLLTHTSGLPVNWGGNDENAPAPPESLRSRTTATRAPGGKIVYANAGYELLGHIAAKVEGEEFSAHVKRVLLVPLGMNSSSFRRADVESRVASGYGDMFIGNAPSTPSFKTVVSPAGSLFTTTRDLLRFARMILQRGELDGARILSAASVDEMLRLQARNHPALDEGYGLGFLVRERSGRKTAWHDGDYPGVASRLQLLPDARAAVAILSNRQDHEPINRIARRALALVAGEERVSAAAPEVAVLNRLAGTYRVLDYAPPEAGPMGWLFNIEVGGGDGALYATIPFLGQRMDFQPLGGSRFRVVGGVLDDNTAVFEGDRLFAGIAEARRIGGWQSARALVLYAGIAALIVIVVLSFVAFRSNVKTKAGFHWGRVLGGGILTELITFALAVPAFLLLGARFTEYFVVPDSFVVALVVGFAVARKAGSRFILHGVFVGGVATIVHFAVVMAQPEPVLYLVAHVMKILGGAAGGHIAQRRESQ